MKIFGREPALWIGVIGSALTWVAGMNVSWLSAGAAVAATTFVSAAVIAVTTRPIAPGLFVAVVSAGAALAAEYGLHWSDASVTALGSLVLAGFALFGIRPQVTPAADPQPIAPATGAVR